MGQNGRNTDLHQTGPLHQLVDLPDGSIGREGAEIGQQIGLLGLEELPEVLVLVRLVPEGTDVHSND